MNGTIKVLWKRDLVRFFRQRSRLAGALAQPLLFWLILGGGLDRSFTVPGTGMGYREYFFPGVIFMVVLFTSIFSTMSLIEDRHAGFLQAVMVAPAGRASIVLGKTLGGVSVAVIQALLVLCMAPLAGFHLSNVDWLAVIQVLLFSSFGLTAIGFALAWWLDSVQGYHAVMSVLLIPAWVVSGAMFPVQGGSPWLTVAMRVNPITYGVEGLRRALYGGHLPAGVGISGSSAMLEAGVLTVFAFVALGIATATCSRRT